MWMERGKDGSNPLKSAIGFLERHYHVPYDQRGMGDAGSEIFGLNAKNHHFKSLGHNPSLLGLFFLYLTNSTTLPISFLTESRWNCWRPMEALNLKAIV